MRVAVALTDRWFVPLLSLAVGTNFLGALALGPFLPTIAAELGVSVALLGQVPAITMLLAAALGLVVGPLADHYGYRRTLVLGLLAVFISGLGTGLAPSYTVLVLVAIVGAVGRAAVLPVAQAIAARRFAVDAARRAVLGQLNACQMGAVVLGVPLLTSIALVAGWRGAFLVLAGVALGSAFVLWSVLPPDAGRRMPAAGVRRVLDGYALLLRDRPSLGLIGSALLSSGGIWAGWTYLAAFYVDQHDFTTLQVGWVFLGCGLAGILGQLAGGGRLGARPRLLVIVGRGGCGLLWGAALVLPLPAATAVGLMVTGQVLFSLSLVGGIILLAEATPAARATALTLHGSALSFGTALGGALGGLVLLWGGYPALGYGSLALLVAAAGVAWWSRPCEELATVSVSAAKA